MHRQSLLHLLRQHQSVDARERAMTDATIAFVGQNPDCFERSLPAGHVTASALIVSPDRQRVVLIHHRKLNRWFQPGGHADGIPDVATVAMQEAREETGLTSLQFIRKPGQLPAVFDVDVHTIPARADVPEHLHYDIRFLLEADPAESFRQNHESNDIRWFTLSMAIQAADSESVARMIRKLPNIDSIT